ncbi:hypothetical protein BRARA_J02553, partial [Brassica rapa]
YNTTFACTGSVGGKTFTSSSSTFTNRRSAEKDAAKLALQHLLNEDTYHATDLRKLVCQNKTRCKMILNEFIDKIEMECVYETVQVEMGHVFVSSLVLNGTCYKGECGKNKKEAEPLAALAAILSLLDDPTYATNISEVINSKGARGFWNLGQEEEARFSKFTASDREQKSTKLHCLRQRSKGPFQGVLMPRTSPIASEPQHETKLPEATQLPFNQIGVPIELKETEEEEQEGKQEIAKELHHLISEPQHEIKLQEATKPASQQIGEFVPVPAAAHNPCNDSIFSKKRRRKNKEKANKRLRAENNSEGSCHVMCSLVL